MGGKKMKINHKVLSIPPFLSTSWKNVASLRLKPDGRLSIALVDGKEVEVPGLQPIVIEAIFAAHERFLETDPASGHKEQGKQIFSMSLPMKMGPMGLDALGPFMQHNQEQANMPNFPPELVQQIAELSKMLNIDGGQLMSQAEPHCNCPHCQIVRALTGQEGKTEQEEIVTDEDLRFCNWKIEKTGDRLYTLTNPLDPNETYNVFLGEPIGCTCGQKSCEHIEAVLQT